jgi:hypothetical protein
MMADLLVLVGGMLALGSGALIVAMLALAILHKARLLPRWMLDILDAESGRHQHIYRWDDIRQDGYAARRPECRVCGQVSKGRAA